MPPVDRQNAGLARFMEADQKKAAMTDDNHTMKIVKNTKIKIKTRVGGTHQKAFVCAVKYADIKC